MILNTEELRSQVDCGDLTDDVIVARLESIEQVIRNYTNNNFQNRNVRFISRSADNRLYGSFQFIQAGDTIQITQSAVNDGLYTVSEVTADYLTVNKTLFDVVVNKVTKVEYGTDVKQCAIDLFQWKLDFGSKVGIKSESETLSRHSQSVTYEDSATLFMGYPVGILSGLGLHKKARC